MHLQGWNLWNEKFSNHHYTVFFTTLFGPHPVDLLGCYDGWLARIKTEIKYRSEVLFRQASISLCSITIIKHWRQTIYWRVHAGHCTVSHLLNVKEIWTRIWPIQWIEVVNRWTVVLYFETSLVVIRYPNGLKGWVDLGYKSYKSEPISWNRELATVCSLPAALPLSPDSGVASGSNG